MKTDAWALEKLFAALAVIRLAFERFASLEIDLSSANTTAA